MRHEPLLHRKILLKKFIALKEVVWCFQARAESWRWVDLW